MWHAGWAGATLPAACGRVAAIGIYHAGLGALYVAATSRPPSFLVHPYYA